METAIEIGNARKNRPYYLNIKTFIKRDREREGGP